MTTRVLLCSDGMAGQTLPAHHDIDLIEDLCRNPERIGPKLAEADRLVLGLCRGQYSLGAIQAQIQRAGIDPLGVELVDLIGFDGDCDRRDVVLNARVARAEAFAGSSPANAKISLARKVNRRELFHGPPHEYRASPTVRTALCVSESGCRACVDVCPRSALTLVDRRVRHDRTSCEPCGLCVTTCPTGAVVNPATTPAQLAAEIKGLLDQNVGAAGPRGILFRCSRGAGARLPIGWYEVSLPCSGMATPGWLLAPLIMGAGAVAVVPCGETGCPMALDVRTLSVIDFCRTFLRRIGESPDRVSDDPAPDIPIPIPPAGVRDPFGPLGAVEVIGALTRGLDDPEDVVVDHPAAPTGVVFTDAATCTRCSRCAQVCPTDALMSSETGDQVTISFDPVGCTACGQCLSSCPELDRGALSLRHTVDLLALAGGRKTLIEAANITCVSCGRPIGPAPLVERVTTLLDPGQERVEAVIASRCVSCRGLAGSRHSRSRH